MKESESTSVLKNNKTSGMTLLEFFIYKIHTWRNRIFSGLKYNDWHFPGCISIEISSACNRSCYYCANSDAYQPKRVMTDETFDILCRRLQYMNWHGDVSFNYLNEPLLDKRLPEFARKLSEMVPGCYPILYNNGDFLTESNMQELIGCGVMEFCVTRHPPTSPEWDERLMQLKKLFPKYLRIRSIDKKPWLTTWAGRLKFSHRLEPFDGRGCDTVSSSIMILADGRIQMCCCDSFQTTIVGNVRDTPLLEIWHSEKYRAVRDQAESGNPTNPTCVACYASRREGASA